MGGKLRATERSGSLPRHSLSPNIRPSLPAPSHRRCALPRTRLDRVSEFKQSWSPLRWLLTDMEPSSGSQAIPGLDKLLAIRVEPQPLPGESRPVARLRIDALKEAPWQEVRQARWLAEDVR